MVAAAWTHGGDNEDASTAATSNNEASASASTRTSNSAATKTSGFDDLNAHSAVMLTPSTSYQQTTVPSTSSSVTSGLSSSSSSGATLASASNQSSPSDLGVPAIVGIVVGVVAVTLMVAAFVIWYKKIKTKSRRLDKLTRSAHETDGLSPSTRNNGEFDVVLESGRAEPPIALLEASDSPKRNAWEDPSIVMARIPLDKIVLLDVVSRGASGVVYRGMYKNEPVAIKRLLPALQRDMRKIDAFLAEIKLVASLEHERIVQFVGVAWDALQDLSLVSEFMDGGDLCSVLETFEAQGRAHGFEADKLRIALHVAHALTYLHSLEPVVLHRDLKSKNVLLNSRLEAKLTDFGVSRGAADGDRTMTAGIGTSWWMAPEVMIGDRYNAKADMFSFGVLLSELDSQALPYTKIMRTATGRPMPSAAVLQMITTGTLRVEFSARVPSALRDLGNACVDIDPAARPSAAQALYELQKLLRERA